MSQLPTGTVTLLFTDIEGSTLLLQQLGERYADIVATCRQLLRTAFQQWNGVEVDTQGDAFFVVFARASDALSAVIDMQRALASHDWPNGAAVALRIGLHTGEPTRTAEGYVGLDVHHAARIMSVGLGGQVLLSQTTHELVKHNLPDPRIAQRGCCRANPELMSESHSEPDVELVREGRNSRKESKQGGREKELRNSQEKRP